MLGVWRRLELANCPVQAFRRAMKMSPPDFSVVMSIEDTLIYMRLTSSSEIWSLVRS